VANLVNIVAISYNGVIEINIIGDSAVRDGAACYVIVAGGINARW